MHKLFHTSVFTVFKLFAHNALSMEAHLKVWFGFSRFYLSTTFQVKINVAGETKRKIKFPLGCSGQRMIAQLHMLLCFGTWVGAILGTS